jgi:hypothetical protein
MRRALERQLKHHREDMIWLRSLELPSDLVDRISLRLDQRGGRWLEVIEELVGYKGDFDSISEELERSPLRSTPIARAC